MVVLEEKIQPATMQESDNERGLSNSVVFSWQDQHIDKPIISMKKGSDPDGTQTSCRGTIIMKADPMIDAGLHLGSFYLTNTPTSGSCWNLPAARHDRRWAL